MGIAAAFLTAFYSWRLLIMTFHGESRADEVTLAHVHESPKVMILPLVFLAIGALFVGFLTFDVFVGEYATAFWGNSLLILDSHPALENAHTHRFGWSCCLGGRYFGITRLPHVYVGA